MVSTEEIKAWLEQGMPNAEVSVTGDGRHFEARVVDASFEGKSTIEQHRLVYAVLGDKVGNLIHALSLKTVIKK